jgi:hypothetical protein
MINSTTLYRLDPEHSSLRLTVLVSFIAACIVCYVVLNTIIRSEGLNLLAFLGAFFGGYVISFILERALKGRWHSGRVLEVSDDGSIRLSKHGTLEQEMRPGADVTPLQWRFEIAKRARVPKGWSMMALALERDGEYLAVYTFMSPDQVMLFDPSGQFKRLQGKKEQPHPIANPLRDDLRLAGEERRLTAAETARWLGGAEMSRADFEALIAWTRRHYAESTLA